jgi:hypothetical protein
LRVFLRSSLRTPYSAPHTASASSSSAGLVEDYAVAVSHITTPRSAAKIKHHVYVRNERCADCGQDGGVT